MQLPRLVFTISKKVDLEVALAFRTIKAGGIDFRTCGLLMPHPNLRARRLTQKAIITYTEKFYREKRVDLEKARSNFEQTWRATSNIFFPLVKALFGSHLPWSGKFVCYPSMWNCNPRDISHKTFQVFYRSDHPLETITHEMLHFAFYDYIFHRYPDAHHKKYSQKLWELSEAFNTIILNSPTWRKRLKARRQPPYPALQNLVRRMRRRWEQNPSVDALLDVFFMKAEGGRRSPPQSSSNKE